VTSAFFPARLLRSTGDWLARISEREETMALKFRTRDERSQPRQSAAPSVSPLTLTERREDMAMSAVEKAALVAGRAIFGGFFLYNGIRHFKERDMLIGYAKGKGVRWPKLAVLGSGAMLVAGGLSLLTGVKPKLGASLVAGFLAGVTPQMHDYWNMTDQMQRMNEMVNFTKNLALIGGAAFALATREKWPWSAA
jgi:putative oxidoreductase